MHVDDEKLGLVSSVHEARRERVLLRQNEHCVHHELGQVFERLDAGDVLDERSECVDVARRDDVEKSVHLDNLDTVD